MTTPQAILEEVLAQTSLTEAEKEDYRDTHGASLVLMAVDIVGEVEEGWIGGSTAESDYLREVGSGAAREGLTAGARWSRRLP